MRFRVLVMGFILVLSAGLHAQVFRNQITGQDRVHGMIRILDKAKSILRVQQPETYSVAAQSFQVAYNDKTVVTLNGNRAQIDDLKEGLQVIVVGKSEEDILKASLIDIRTEK